MEFVRSIARRVTVLHEGRVLAEGDMDQVQNDPRVIEVYLGGKDERADGQRPSISSTAAATRCGMSTSTVPAGSRTCLMGRNGMGKTTLLKCIMGLLPATSGEIAFDGTDLRSLPAESRARLGIGYVPQGREIFPQLTVEENLRVGLGIRKNGAANDSVRRSSTCSPS